MKRDWYRIEAKGDDAADVYVFGDIGKSYWDDDTVTATKFIADLKALPATAKTIRIHVSSLGGSVFEAHAIANALRAEREERGRTIDVRIEAIAASAATIITSAGKPIRIADNAMMMIHEPSAMEWGTATAMRKMADVLDAIKKSIISAYRWVSNKTEDELATMMAETTWMDAATAVAAGFATEIMTDGPVVTARFDPKNAARLGEIPEPFKAQVTALLATPESTQGQSASSDVPAAAAATDVLRLCREADCLDLAEGFVQAGASLDQVAGSLATAKAARAAEHARSEAITAACTLAHLPDLAPDYIAGGMPVDRVRAQLLRVTARLEAGELDGALAPNAAVAGRREGAVLESPAAIYHERNRKPQS
jgi:ATP-dependent protease ClpP protease subunit